MKVKEPVLLTLAEMSHGLTCYNVLKIVKESKELFSPIFCPSDIFKWTHELFQNSILPSFSEVGSNKRNIEISVYKYFLDMVEAIFMDG